MSRLSKNYQQDNLKKTIEAVCNNLYYYQYRGEGIVVSEATKEIIEAIVKHVEYMPIEFIGNPPNTNDSFKATFHIYHSILNWIKGEPNVTAK